MKCYANSDITSDHTDQISLWLNAVHFYLAKGSILTCCYYHELSLWERHQIAKLHPFVHAHRAKYKAADSHSEVVDVEVVDVEVVKRVGCLGNLFNFVCLVFKNSRCTLYPKSFLHNIMLKNVITLLFFLYYTTV